VIRKTFVLTGDLSVLFVQAAYFDRCLKSWRLVQNFLAWGEAVEQFHPNRTQERMLHASNRFAV
jgi:hypothetical protein